MDTDYVTDAVLTALSLPITERNRKIAFDILKEKCPEALVSGRAPPASVSEPPQVSTPQPPRKVKRDRDAI